VITHPPSYSQETYFYAPMRLPSVLLRHVDLEQRKRGEFGVSSGFIPQGPFAKFVDWPQCAAVMQREEMTVVSSSSGGVT
jgi:hypothetical protein